jgi:bacterial/archaeal transporter family protein
MSLLLLPILAGLLSAGFDMLLKSIVRKNISPATYLFLIYSLITLCTLPLLITHFNIVLNVVSWLALLFAILSYVFANFCLVSAFKHADISNVAIVTKISFVLTFISGIIIFKEPVTLYKIVGTLVIIVGIVAIFFEKQKIRSVSLKGLVFALLNGAGYTFAASFSKYALQSFSPYCYIFFIYAGLMFSYAFFPNVISESKELYPKIKFYLIALAIIGSGSYLTYLISLKYLNFSTTYILYGSISVITSVVFGMILLREKGELLNKFIGLICIIMGIILFYI